MTQGARWGARATVCAVTAITTAMLTSCAASPGGTPTQAPSSTASASTSPDATTTATTPPAVAALRTALEASLSAILATGLTETWVDESGATTLVQVYDPGTKSAASSDCDDAQGVDVDVMMPGWLLAELDDTASVESASGTFTITDRYGDDPFTATYTLDAQGRIAAATVTGADVEGSATFDYSVTAVGRDVLAAAAR